jgi:hypothetical protein
VDRICSTEKSESICQTAQGHKPDNHSIILHRGENLKVLQSVEVFGAFIQGVSFILPHVWQLYHIESPDPQAHPVTAAVCNCWHFS